MGPHGEWIDFAELCRRVPGLSARTLRQRYKDKVISYRQLKRGGKVQFNWRTVERELEALVQPGIHAAAAIHHQADGLDLHALEAKVDRLQEQLATIDMKLNTLLAWRSAAR